MRRARGSASALRWWISILGAVLAASATLAACGDAQDEAAPQPQPQPQPQPDAGSESDAGPALPKLGLNDVSVLLPLPASDDATTHLVPTSAGAKGELLPESVYGEIPEFPVTPAQGLDYARMRVVGIRFDGCHPKPTGCEAQIRLVMQPIASNGSMRDSALHLFYPLTEAELAEVVPELRRLRTLAPEVLDAPLDVHASLVAQGMDGPYGAALKELVLRYCGEQSLSRMTFFLRAPPVNEVWFFGGFERASGVLTVMDIAGLGQGNQQVIRTEVADGYDYTVNPITSVPPAERPLLSTTRAEEATAEQRSAAFSAYLRVQNPVHFGADELSCVTCHIGTYVIEQTRASYGLDPASFGADGYTSTHDLTVTGGARQTPASLRAFGYFERDPMIAQRVVHESASIVDAFEARFPPE